MFCRRCFRSLRFLCATSARGVYMEVVRSHLTSVPSTSIASSYLSGLSLHHSRQQMDRPVVYHWFSGAYFCPIAHWTCVNYWLTSTDLYSTVLRSISFAALTTHHIASAEPSPPSHIGKKNKIHKGIWVFFKFFSTATFQLALCSLRRCRRWAIGAVV